MSKDWKVTNRSVDLDIPIFALFGVRAGRSTYTVRNRDTGQTEHVTVRYNEDRSKEQDSLGDKISERDFDED